MRSWHHRVIRFIVIAFVGVAVCFFVNLIYGYAARNRILEKTAFFEIPSGIEVFEYHYLAGRFNAVLYCEDEHYYDYIYNEILMSDLKKKPLDYDSIPYSKAADGVISGEVLPKEIVERIVLPDALCNETIIEATDFFSPLPPLKMCCGTICKIEGGTVVYLMNLSSRIQVHAWLYQV